VAALLTVKNSAPLERRFEWGFQKKEETEAVRGTRTLLCALALRETDIVEANIGTQLSRAAF